MLPLKRFPRDLRIQTCGARCDSPSGSKLFVFVCTTTTPQPLARDFQPPKPAHLQLDQYTRRGLAIAVVQGPSYHLSRVLRET